jgi:hypothetical protein
MMSNAKTERSAQDLEAEYGDLSGKTPNYRGHDWRHPQGMQWDEHQVEDGVTVYVITVLGSTRRFSCDDGESLWRQMPESYADTIMRSLETRLSADDR